MLKWLVVAAFLLSGAAASAQVADTSPQNGSGPGASASPGGLDALVGTSDSPAADDPAAKAVRANFEDGGASGARAGRPSAYYRGRLDRQAWQTWLNAQSGDTHVGAAYWASNRSVARHRQCASFSDQSVDCIAGCKTWTALDADSNLIVSYFVADRWGESAIVLMDNLRARLANRVQLTTDGHRAYLEAAEGPFGGDVD